jgi:hypothetical protein
MANSKCLSKYYVKGLYDSVYGAEAVNCEIDENEYCVSAKYAAQPLYIAKFEKIMDSNKQN